MNVLFINTPSSRISIPKHINNEHLTAVSAVESLGTNVAYLDIDAYRIDGPAVISETKELDNNILAFWVDTRGYHWFKTNVALLCDVNNDATIVVLGPLAEAIPKIIMKLHPQIDACVSSGDPEVVLEDLVQGLMDKKKLGETRGLTIRKRGKLVKTGAGRKIEHMDDLPFPAYHLAPLDAYFANSRIDLSPQGMLSHRRLSVNTQRKDGRECSPEYLASLIKDVRLKYCVDFVSILNGDLAQDEEFIGRFCDALEKEEVVGLLNWGCSINPNKISKDLMKRLHECGCTYITANFVHVSSKVIKDLENLDESSKEKLATGRKIGIKNLVKVAQESAMVLTPLFTIGMPGETRDSIKELGWFIHDSGIKANVLFYSVSNTGAKLKANMKKIGRGAKGITKWLLKRKAHVGHEFEYNATDELTTAELIGLKYMCEQDLF